MANNGNERGDEVSQAGAAGPAVVDGDIAEVQDVATQVCLVAQDMGELIALHRTVGKVFHLAMGDRAAGMKKFFAQLADIYSRHSGEPFYQSADERGVEPVQMEFTSEEVEQFKAVLDRLGVLDEDARMFVMAVILEGAGGSGSGLGESHEDQGSRNIDTLIELVRELIGKVRELNDLHNAVGAGFSLMMADRAGEVVEFYNDVTIRIGDVQTDVHAMLEEMLALKGGDFGNGADVVGLDVSDEIRSTNREITRSDLRRLAAALRIRRNLDESERKFGSAGGLRRGGLEGVPNSPHIQKVLDRLGRGEPLVDGGVVGSGNGLIKIIDMVESGQTPETRSELPKITARLVGNDLIEINGRVFRLLGTDGEEGSRQAGADETSRALSGVTDRAEMDGPSEETENEWPSRLRKFNYLSGRGLKQYEAAQNFMREAVAGYLERLVGISNEGIYSDGENSADEKPGVGSWDLSGTKITIEGNELRVRRIKGGQRVHDDRNLEDVLREKGVNVTKVNTLRGRSSRGELDCVFDLHVVAEILEQKKS